MSYSEEEKNDILCKAIKIASTSAMRSKNGVAPDILIEPVLNVANELIAKYEDDPTIDIWKNARLDRRIKYIIETLMLENYYDYELSEENFEAVNALIEAEEMLGEQTNDADLFDYFDYTPEELERLRILAKYLNGIDRESAYKEFAQKYHLHAL